MGDHNIATLLEQRRVAAQQLKDGECTHYGNVAQNRSVTDELQIAHLLVNSDDTNEEWVVVEAESFVKQARGNGLPITYVQRDRDRKFTKSFDAKLKSLRVKIKPGAFCAQNTNAFVERLIQSIGQECLDRFVVFGKQNTWPITMSERAFRSEEESRAAEERPHQSLGAK